MEAHPQRFQHHQHVTKRFSEEEEEAETQHAVTEISVTWQQHIEEPGVRHSPVH